ncbi:TPA: UDP-N-acetylmuramoyl-L-alanine--D-glutamate ligase, partial [Campylobacter fetus subsp. venerealis]|nr:UDP-N-acetylmuramoyl-L-alanine--D-glutamate ligase [Campylobacter fetus subsp. venerealis]
NKAVENINTVMKIDEIGLLSPACASLDQFKSYAERGDMFKKYVNSL